MSAADDTTPTVEVVDYSNLRPCPPLPGPWPERVTARCVCCDDRMEVFIDQRAWKDGNEVWQTIPLDEHPLLLARAASTVGLDGRGGWLLVQSAEHGYSWVCRECCRVAIDFTSPEVQEAVQRWIGWLRVEVVDKSAGAPRRWGRR